MDWLSSLPAFLESARKWTPLPLIAIAIGSGVVLFVPDGWASVVGVAQFREDHRVWVGLMFLAACCVLAAQGLTFAGQSMKARRNDRARQEAQLRMLQDLTDEEVEFLLKYVRDGKNTVVRDITDGVAGGLCAKNVIYRASNVLHFSRVPYNLQPWARSLLNQYPELLA